MPVATAAELMALLRQQQLLTEPQLAEIAGKQAKFADAKALARELMQRNWLTAFQVNQLLQGRGTELVLGDNLLLDRLGAGGMGAVYKARHKRLDRTLAIKVIGKEHLANATAVQRFQQEARAVARLSHPNIVGVYDAGEANGTTATCGSGARTRSLAILKIPRPPRSVSSGAAAGAAAGTTIPRPAARRAAPCTRRRTGTAASGCAWSEFPWAKTSRSGFPALSSLTVRLESLTCGK